MYKLKFFEEKNSVSEINNKPKGSPKSCEPVNHGSSMTQAPIFLIRLRKTFQKSLKKIGHNPRHRGE